jgi:hypothetical protein
MTTGTLLPVGRLDDGDGDVIDEFNAVVTAADENTTRLA